MKNESYIIERLKKIKEEIPDRKSRNDSHFIYSYKVGWYDALKWVLEEE